MGFAHLFHEAVHLELLIRHFLLFLRMPPSPNNSQCLGVFGDLQSLLFCFKSAYSLVRSQRLDTD